MPSAEMIRAYGEVFGVIGILGLTILILTGAFVWTLKTLFRYLVDSSKVLQRICDQLEVDKK